MSTAISSISSTGAASTTSFDPAKGASRLAAKVFGEMDADTDGKVSKDEFVKGLESKGVSTEDAGKQYAAIDKEGTGSITQDDLTSAIKSGDFKPPRPQDAEAQQASSGANGGGGGGGSVGGSSSAAKTYEAADKNEDGTVTQQEQLVYELAQANKAAASAATNSANLGNNVDAMA